MTRNRALTVVLVSCVTMTAAAAECFPIRANTDAYWGPVASSFRWDWGEINGPTIYFYETNGLCQREYPYAAVANCDGFYNKYSNKVSLPCCTTQLSQLYICYACSEDILHNIDFCGHWFQYDPGQFRIRPQRQIIPLNLAPGTALQNPVTVIINGPVIRSVVNHSKKEDYEKWRCEKPSCSWLNLLTAKGRFGDELEFTVDAADLCEPTYECRLLLVWDPLMAESDHCITTNVPMERGNITVKLSIQCAVPELHVDIHGGGDYTDIQSAIDAACPGATITVAKGEYPITEPITIAKSITVKSTDGPEATIIRMDDPPADPERASVVLSDRCAPKLQGFTLTGGQGTSAENLTQGGGILCTDTSTLTVENCWIEKNKAVDGAAVCCKDRATINLSGCKISRNTQTLWPHGETKAAIWIDGLSATLQACTIVGNKTGGVRGLKGKVKLFSCLIAGHYTCTVRFLSGSTGLLVNCTITGARPVAVSSWSAEVTLCNCIVWGNGEPFEIGAGMPEENLMVSYSCIEGEEVWPGEGNINEDPLFSEAGRWDENGTPDNSLDDIWIEGDYSLQCGSPCIDTGTSEGAPPFDIEGYPRPCGPGVDIGAYEYCLPDIPIPFRRGDSNANGNDLNLADAIYILQYQFADGPEPACMDAADANDDGAVDIGDSVFLLQYLFVSGPVIPPPSAECGMDPTPDQLTCLDFAPCE